MDGKFKYDGTFHYGYSINNTARAHQIESGLYNGCFVSTTKSEAIAIRFATKNFTEPGWIYVIDETLLIDHNVISLEFYDPLYPDELEVSLAASNNGALPEKIIIEKFEVKPCGAKV